MNITKQKDKAQNKGEQTKESFEYVLLVTGFH